MLKCMQLSALLPKVSVHLHTLRNVTTRSKVSPCGRRWLALIHRHSDASDADGSGRSGQTRAPDLPLESMSRPWTAECMTVRRSGAI